MVKNNEHKVHIARKMVQLLGEPLPLRAGDFVERTVQHQHQRVGGADGVVDAVFHVGEALEIVSKSNFFAAVKIVVAERGVDRNLFLSPRRRFSCIRMRVVTLLELQHNNFGIRSQPQRRSPRSRSARSENLHLPDSA